MEQREIEVTLISAQNLKKVTTFGKQSVYAVAWVHPGMKVSSPMDTKGNLSPTWNAKLKLMADERLVQEGNVVLVVDLYHHGSLGNKLVGSSTIPLSDLRVVNKDDNPDHKPEMAGKSVDSSFKSVPVCTPLLSFSTILLPTHSLCLITCQNRGPEPPPIALNSGESAQS